MTSVAVIVAARNAAPTIGAAVSSALGEPEVRRVVVVDDASTDGTGEAARAADDGSGRLRLLRHDVNRGPSAARNAAFAEVEEQFVAILDADDRFLPGRIARLMAAAPFDMAADDIAFVAEGSPLAGDPARLSKALEALETPGRRWRDLSLAEFVEGNVTRPGHPRAELGFLKPILRSEVLRGAAGPWDEALRLGEDYDLYVRLLAAGATFKLVACCGYLALERANSLSGRHSVQDLERFAAIDDRLMACAGLDPRTRRAVALHRRQGRDRFEHRRFLEVKAAGGLARAIGHLLRRPHAWTAVTMGIARDKLRAARRTKPEPSGGLRLLLGPVAASAANTPDARALVMEDSEGSRIR